MQQDGNDCAGKLRARTRVRSQEGQYEECAGGGGRQWGGLVVCAASEERASEEQTVG